MENNSKNTSINKLNLSDYDKIWCKFCFMDESGGLSNQNDPYFTLGILKMTMPFYLQNKIQRQRDVSKFYDELKFNKISDKNINFAKFIIDCIFNTIGLNFYSYTLNTNSEYFKNNFSDNIWSSYEQITLKLIQRSLNYNEIIILIADQIITPKDVKFEVCIKKTFNKSNKRLAAAGVCRFDSKSNDLLQAVDIIIGCITYDIKFKNNIVKGSVCKIDLVNYFKDKLKTCSDNFDIYFDHI